MLFAGMLLLVAMSLAAIVVSLLVSLYQWEASRYVRRRLRSYQEDREKQYTPQVSVLVPVKGLDLGLEDNLAALFQLDYPHYSLVFIVESEDDPAVPIVDRLVAQASVPCRRVVAGISGDSGQKVHNLRVATSKVYSHGEVLAFVDADARPHPSWLRKLVSLLGQRRVGASTGYRWMVPERLSLANLVLYAANSGVAGLLGRQNYNLIWGGSWALRRETFEKIRLHDEWWGTLSDDLVAARAVSRHGRDICFEPGTLCASPVDVDWFQLFEFVRRQYVIARRYAPFHWRWGFVGTTLMQLGFWGNVAAAIGLLATGRIEWVASAATAVFLYGLAMLRAWYRQDVARKALPALAGKLRWPARFDILASPFVGLISWLTMLSSAFGDCITWRDVRYRIRPGGQIELLHRRTQPSGESADARSVLQFPGADESGTSLPGRPLCKSGRRAAA
jgi:hypothetical protein